MSSVDPVTPGWTSSVVAPTSRKPSKGSKKLPTVIFPGASRSPTRMPGRLDDLFQGFSGHMRSGSGPAGPLCGLVVPDDRGEGEYALEYAYPDTGSGASAVTFETELVFEGVVDRFDGLA